MSLIVNQNQSYIPLHFWFNKNPGLAIPYVCIPFVHNAVLIIQRWWKIVLAQRHLMRLKVGREILVLPGIGVKYFSAMSHFNSQV